MSKSFRNGSSGRANKPLPPSLQGLFSQAVARHQAGRIHEALGFYERVLEGAPRHFDSLNLAGLASLQAGDPQRGARWLAAAVELNPGSVATRNNLGVALLDLGRSEEALAVFDRAIGLQRDFVDAHFNRGKTLLALARFEQAVDAFDATARLKPGHAEALQYRGVALKMLGRNEEALASFDAALAIRADYPDAHNNRGVTLFETGRYEEAIAAFAEVLRLRGPHPDPYNNLGRALQELRRPTEAIDAFDAALKLRPDYPDALNSRGNSLLELRRLEEALASFEAAIRHRPGYVEAINNRGNALLELRRFEQAIVEYDQALRLRPDFAEAHVNRSNALMQLTRPAEALADLDAAVRLQPELAGAHLNRAHLWLNIGDYPQGWREFEWRWKAQSRSVVALRSVDHGLWLGQEPIAGSTLVLCHEQGVGDTLQFCRYGRLAAEAGARVVALVPKPLTRLMSTQPWVSQVVETGQSLPPFDFHCPMMSLPLAFGTTLETIPFGDEPYLLAPAGDVERWGNWLEERLLGSSAVAEGGRHLRVGLVWNGGFRADQPELWAVNERRNVPLELFAAALDLPGVDFVSLQKGDPAESELRGREREFWKIGNLLNPAPELTDFADTAGLIANLDLVISVDTSTAHLAAAMGKPTWILNRHDTCWRWLFDREDSPWYGSVKLFRQGADRDWRPVLARVASTLQYVVGGA